MSTQFKKIIGYLLVVFLVIGFFVLYRYVQPTGYQLPDDPLALEALELVKKHRSRQGYTLDEALQLLVDDLVTKGIPFREGDWQVKAQGEDKYMVRKIVREKGSVEWIEREYAWRVDSKEKSIRVISLAAQQLMPFENLPPLPHGDQISSLPHRMLKVPVLTHVEGKSANGVLLT
ncbi:MAG: hypothetical protein H0W49_07595 [Nitrospirales bacterium]|nr:hypothetical protein [Nitrospirales bacterium]MBA3968116.1 hypothetical protein [Nitrospirales bacterium]